MRKTFVSAKRVAMVSFAARAPREIVTERLLDDDARPALRGTALADSFDDNLELGGWNREVVEAIARVPRSLSSLGVAAR